MCEKLRMVFLIVFEQIIEFVLNIYKFLLEQVFVKNDTCCQFSLINVKIILPHSINICSKSMRNTILNFSNQIMCSNDLVDLTWNDPLDL